jgi:hypothetical protein
MTKSKHGKKKKRGRPPGSKGKVTTKTAGLDKGETVKVTPTEPLIDCEFCEYKFAESLGRYGCPNCEGGPDEPDPSERTLGGVLMGYLATNQKPKRNLMITWAIVPTFGSAGPEQSLKGMLVRKDEGWKGFSVLTDGDKVWLEPYKA